MVTYDKYDKKDEQGRLLKKQNVTILSSIEWDWQWHRHHRITFWFSQHCRKVVYVENLPKRFPKIGEIRRVIKRFWRQANNSRTTRKYQSLLDKNKNIEIISPLTFPATNRVIDWVNRKLLLPPLVTSIKKRLSFERPIIWCYLPTQSVLDLIDLLQPKLLVYDCVTNYTANPLAPKNIMDIENTLLTKADIVIVDSDFLYERKSRLRDDIIQILPGVNCKLFQKARTGLVREPVRRVCYFGGINSLRIDFDVIEAVSLAGFEIWLIGPVRSQLPALPKNVKFLGVVEHEKLPGYLKNCDCLILPYRVNEYTKGIIPAKFFECFATGKPIIATPLPNFLPYKDLLVVATTPQEFVYALNNIGNFDNQKKYEQRIALANEHSEERQFDELPEVLLERLSKKNKGKSK